MYLVTEAPPRRERRLCVLPSLNSIRESGTDQLTEAPPSMTLVTCNPAAEGRESSVAAVSKLESRVLLGGIEMSATEAGKQGKPQDQ